MWFKNLQLYRLDNDIDTASLDPILAKRQFVQAGQLDRLSAGWIPPASHAPDLFAYPVAGAWMIALKTEEKILPSSVVKEEAATRIEAIEAKELRKVGKKEAKEIRERVADELLPRAFSRTRVLRAVIDPAERWIWVDTPTAAKAELILQLLRESIGSLHCRLPQTKLEPVTAMTTWLEHGAPEGFTLDADCVLKAPGDGAPQVTCRRHDLSSEEIQLHLKSGKMATQLALSFADRLSFVLGEKLQIKRLGFLDVLEDQIKTADAEDAAAMFDTSATLLVEEGRALIKAIIDALDGEMQRDTSAPSASAPAAVMSGGETTRGQDVPW
ncbi:recombination-associated protein RdgC [Burkholderiaceae bacterium DAT-1]|nr:recombination-associated protein RdgC [Burkholderiaceae bacterium DAT-1]